MIKRMLLILALALPLHAHGIAKFINGWWFDGTTFQKHDMYSVEGVLASHHEGPIDRTIDLDGAYAIPPFADAHTHALGGPDEETLRAFINAGILYVKNPNSMASQTEKVRPRVNTAYSVDVVWALGGLTSTGGHPTQIYEQVAKRYGLDPATMAGDAYWIVDDAPMLAAQWPRILAGKPDFIKIYLDQHALDPRLVPEIVKRAHAAGLRVTAHVRSAEDFRIAIRAGVDELAHMPLEPITNDDAALAAKSGAVVVTTMLSHRPIPTGLDLDALYRGNLERLRAAGTKIALGTDSAHTVLDEVERINALGVFNRRALLKMLVEQTPATIFPNRKIGKLADGYEANFIALAGNPLADFAALRNVKLRVKKGHVLGSADVSSAVVGRPARRPE